MTYTQIHKRLKYNFVIAIAITLFHIIIGYIISVSGFISVRPELSPYLKTAIILFVLVSIPLDLKWFATRLRKIADYTDYDRKVAAYIKYSRIRVLVILVGLISAIMFFFIRQMNDMLYLIGIEVIILLLCMPTKKRVESEMAVFAPDEDNYHTTE